MKNKVMSVFSGGGSLLSAKIGGFTLAEVLITLGIIGVVAAMTIPTLMTSYKKKAYYTKFMKARSSIENALRLAKADGESGDTVEQIGKYFNGVKYITHDNCEEILSGYDKLLIKRSDNKEGEWSGSDVCDTAVNMLGENELGFISMDGMLLLYNTDDGVGGGGTLDTNGPNEGPNVYGRDIFVFYDSVLSDDTWGGCISFWGNSKRCAAQGGFLQDCMDSNTTNTDCAMRLIEEGKMDY